MQNLNFLKGQRSKAPLPEDIHIPGLLPCLVSQLALLAELQFLGPGET